jgi:hypothetical protein
MAKFQLSCMPSIDHVGLGTSVTPVACPHMRDVDTSMNSSGAVRA